MPSSALDDTVLDRDEISSANSPEQVVNSAEMKKQLKYLNAKRELQEINIKMLKLEQIESEGFRGDDDQASKSHSPRSVFKERQPSHVGLNSNSPSSDIMSNEAPQKRIKLMVGSGPASPIKISSPVD